jgi:hypothetical protein
VQTDHDMSILMNRNGLQGPFHAPRDAEPRIDAEARRCASPDCPMKWLHQDASRQFVSRKA